MTDFDKLIDTSGLAPDEEARLRRVHQLLLEAGPPADLPPALDRPPTEERGGGEILQFPLMPKRRWSVAFVAAAALALAAFGGGYLFGHSKARPAAFGLQRVVTMSPVNAGTPGLAVLQIAPKDSAGNWPMEMSVSGLPQQTQRAAYYELWLTRNGKPSAPCGTFRVHGNTTTVRLTVPYQLSTFDGWVVTANLPHAPDPGHVILTT